MNEQARIAKLQGVLVEKGLSGALISAPASVQYLTGFCSCTYSRPLFVVVPQRGLSHLVIPSIERYLAEEYACVAYSGYDDPSPLPEVTRLLRELRFESPVGYEASAMTAALFAELSERTNVELKDCSGLLDQMRVIKDRSEIDLTRTAGSICAEAARAAQIASTPGTPEVLTKFEGEKEIYRFTTPHPQHKFAFFSNVISGERGLAAGGHDISTGRRIVAGEPVFHVWLVSCDGYWTFIVRTVVSGGGNPKVTAMLKWLQEARDESLLCVRAGVEFREAVGAARDVLEKGRVLHLFRKLAVARGIGLSWSEPPSVALDRDGAFEEGMVLRFGLECYSEEIGGAVGIGDTIVVTERGCEVLTTEGSCP